MPNPTRSLRRHALAAAVLLAATAPALRADVLVVHPVSGPFTQVQDAVAAANAGDLILVHSGNYGPVTVDGKSLTIAADEGQVPILHGTTTVRNLAVGQTVVLSGIHGTGLTTNSPADDAGVGLLLRANAGHVRVERCMFLGAIGYGDGATGTAQWDGCCELPLHDNGWDGAWVDGSSAGTSFTGSSLRGGRGARASFNCWCGTGDRGGDGLRVTGAMVAVYDGILAGGRGGDNGYQGGPGGAGLRTETSGGALVSGATMMGGRGGDGYDYIISIGGDGGSGAHYESDTALQRIGCTFQPGVGGLACGGLFPPGFDGQPTTGTGTLFTFNVPSVTFTTPLVARESTSLPMTVTGAPGALAALRIARAPEFLPLPSQRGVLLARQPTPPEMRILGTIPGDGILNTSLPLQPLGPGVAASTFYMQAAIFDAVTGTTLGSSVALTVLDSAL